MRVRNPLALQIDIDHLLVVEPAFDLAVGDADADGVPLILIELFVLRRFVFGGVEAVDAGEADDRAGPAADDERGVRIADGERQAAEEVVSLPLHRLQRDLEIVGRDFAAVLIVMPVSG